MLIKRVTYLFLSLILGICLTPNILAQEPDWSDLPPFFGGTRGFNTESMASEKSILGDDRKLVKKGDQYIYYGQKNYPTALEYYLKAYEHNNDNSQLNFKIGYCYLQSGNKAKSVVYLGKALELNRRVHVDLHDLLGQAYHISEDFEKAIEQYKLHIEISNKRNRSKSPAEQDSIMAMTHKRIIECESGIELMKNPVGVFIDNVGEGINTEFPEYGPVVTADESVLFFTSRREDSKGGEKSDLDHFYYEDIYVSTLDSTNKWSEAKRLGSKVNSSTNDAVAGISLDGQRLFVYRDNNGGDIYLSKLRGENWSSPSKLNKKVNSVYHESYASYSYNQQITYFISDDPEQEGHIGGKDIYQCLLNKRGKCTEVSNLGPQINTIYNETSVFAHPDGKTLYFSSKGHNTMGGYDVFSSVWKNGAWSKPENIGYPINTVGNEVSFSITANGKTGYFSSSRYGGKGGKDVYSITFNGPAKEGIINNEDNLIAQLTNPIKEKVIEPKVPKRKMQLTLLKGVISDAITTDFLEASIEIFDNEKNELIGTFSSNSATGKYLISLPSGKNYGISVKAKGYLFYSDNIIIPASGDYKVVRKDVALNKLDIGSKVVLKNIFFDTAKDSLRSESFAELGRLKKLLDDFPYLTIEISGHTDNVGGADYNKDLSNRRANSVVNYLVAHDVASERFTHAGYGFDQPIDTNDTPEGRQNNRRTEFKITGTDYKAGKEKKEKKVVTE